jgi:hypothetical protein
MSKTAVIFFTLLLVFTSCFIAGCSSLPSSDTSSPSETPGRMANTPQNNVQNNAVPQGEPTSQRFAFENVLQDLARSDLETPVDLSEPTAEHPKNTSPGAASETSSIKQIKQIRAGDLDEKGAARSWTFIVEHAGTVSVVSFGNKGMVFSGSPGTLSQPEIITDKIISPSSLFSKNHDVIFNTSKTGTAVTRDLSLVGNNYTISISTGLNKPPRLLVFDATTGVLISSND